MTNPTLDVCTIIATPVQGVPMYEATHENGGYNGFSRQFRQRVGSFQNRQFAKGFPKPAACMACGQTEGKLWAHLEDYDAALDYLPLCYPCHTTLHARYHRRWMYDRWFAAVAKGFRPVPFDSVNWHHYRRLYMQVPVEQWEGVWTDVPGDLTLMGHLGDHYLENVPEHLAISLGAPHLPGQMNSSTRALTPRWPLWRPRRHNRG